jgi:GDP-mannose 6-dehydrogenase
MKISVFGLGYVGTVCAGCLAKDGHKVIGVDPNSYKVNLINQGASTIIEDDIGDIVKAAVAGKHLSATDNFNDAIAKTDISLVCVGTPSQSNGDLDISQLKRVCIQIGNALKNKSMSHLVVIRSTVIPGTTDDILIPLLEKHSGKKCGHGLLVGYNPEFLREGTSVYDYYNPPKIVIGQKGCRATKLSTIYKNIPAAIIVTDIRTAEMVKYADNAFHAVKVVFANEIGNICKQLKVDSHAVMRIFCQDTKLNLSPYYLRPGFAFGGSCLPKDIRAILYRAKTLDLSVPMLASILPSNELQVKAALDLVEGGGSKKIGLLGLSFKAGTDDLRESPLVKLSEFLIGKGYDLKIYDENVSLAKIFGANKQYIEQEIPHISSLMCSNIQSLLAHADTLIIGNYLKKYWKALKNVIAEKTVIDLVRCNDIITARPARYFGIAW